MADIPNVAARHQAVVQGWQTDLELRQHPFETRRTYLSSVRAWLAHLDVLPPTEAGKEQLKTYAAALLDKKRKPSTFQSHFAAISSLFDYMIEEELVKENPVPAFQRRYMRLVSKKIRKSTADASRQLISIQDAAQLIAGIGDVRDRLTNVLLAKTGMRREELAAVDLSDLDWTRQSITINDWFPKRTNLVVYFDDETGRLMKRWLRLREARGADPESGPLLVGPGGERLGAKGGIYGIVTKHAAAAGLHKPGGEMRDKFTPHCWRHWFTTHLRRAGMPDHMIAELRGDSDARTLDIYHHVDHEELRRVYIARVPQLGV